ncbi:uncharacterized protein A4U43_C08F35900 [Asparagus officinalis]|nr:uncharacterized protein A4U43_C08F35900 [Asparagus officinalis]
MSSKSAAHKCSYPSLSLHQMLQSQQQRNELSQHCAVRFSLVITELLESREINWEEVSLERSWVEIVAVAMDVEFVDGQSSCDALLPFFCLGSFGSVPVPSWKFCFLLFVGPI